MTDLSLSDLATDGAAKEAAAATVEETAESGESLKDMIEFLDDRGYLGPLIFGQTGIEQPEGGMDTVDDTGGGPALTAENIAAFGDAITSQVGDMPLSSVVDYARDHPDEVDQIINQNV